MVEGSRRETHGEGERHGTRTELRLGEAEWGQPVVHKFDVRHLGPVGFSHARLIQGGAEEGVRTATERIAPGRRYKAHLEHARVAAASLSVTLTQRPQDLGNKLVFL